MSPEQRRESDKMARNLGTAPGGGEHPQGRRNRSSPTCRGEPGRMWKRGRPNWVDIGPGEPGKGGAELGGWTSRGPRPCAFLPELAGLDAGRHRLRGPRGPTGPPGSRGWARAGWAGRLRGQKLEAAACSARARDQFPAAARSGEAVPTAGRLVRHRVLRVRGGDLVRPLPVDPRGPQAPAPRRAAHLPLQLRDLDPVLAGQRGQPRA